MIVASTPMWRLDVLNEAYAHITQVGTRVIRTVMRGTLPPADDILAMTPRRFESVMREAFHSVG